MKTILFQGDSITDCGRLRKNHTNVFMKALIKFSKRTPLGSGYPSLVAKEMGNDFDFVNRGVSGDRVPDVYARIVRDIIKIKPDYMSILVGVNDIWHGFDFDNETGTKRLEKVYNIIIEELKEELPETKIMIMEPFILEGSATKNRENEPDRYERFKKGITEVAEITRSLAEKHNLIFIPLQNVLDEAAKELSPEMILSDGVHPTERGHEIIKNEWIKAFKTL